MQESLVDYSKSWSTWAIRLDILTIAACSGCRYRGKWMGWGQEYASNSVSRYLPWPGVTKMVRYTNLYCCSQCSATLPCLVQIWNCQPSIVLKKEVSKWRRGRSSVSLMRRRFVPVFVATLLYNAFTTSVIKLFHPMNQLYITVYNHSEIDTHLPSVKLFVLVHRQGFMNSIADLWVVPWINSKTCSKGTVCSSKLEKIHTQQEKSTSQLERAKVSPFLSLHWVTLTSLRINGPCFSCWQAMYSCEVRFIPSLKGVISAASAVVSKARYCENEMSWCKNTMGWYAMLLNFELTRDTTSVMWAWSSFCSVVDKATWIKTTLPCHSGCRVKNCSKASIFWRTPLMESSLSRATMIFLPAYFSCSTSTHLATSGSSLFSLKLAISMPIGNIPIET